MKILIILLALWTAKRVVSQSGACPAQTPCLCEYHQINCAGHGLNIKPVFVSTGGGGSFTELHLSNNHLTTIPTDSFSALNVTTILLDNNNINYIHPNAFTGVMTFLKHLNLAHNNLTTLPHAIEVIKLQSLDVSWNPIPGYTAGRPHRPGKDGLTDSVMRYLGSSLTKFTFGDSTLTSWPHSLNHLNQLVELKVSGANITYLPSTAFHGFEQTLKKLTIEYAALAAVPLAITSLRQLEELHLDHLNVPGKDGQTVMFGDMSMTAAPFGPISATLKTLSLEYDGLTTFPEVISDLRALEDISLSGNNLEFVSDEAIQLLKHSNVTELRLSNCNLTRIPGSISDLTKLTHLDFSNNHIRSIESTDLQNLYNLTTLSLSRNPLRYISDDSLCGLDSLTNLNLDNSNLTELSRSLKNLGKLELLNLQNSRIDCTCDITWFKGWLDVRPTCPGHHRGENDTLDILGDCETINQSIVNYIYERLPSCLEYQDKTGRGIKESCSGNCTSKRR